VRRRSIGRTAASLLWLVVVGACAPGPVGSPADSLTGQDVIPVVVSPVLAVGPNRFVYSLVDGASNEPIARPDRRSTVAFLPPGSTDDAPVSDVASTFIWAVDDLRGLYVARTTFDRPGRWTAQITLVEEGTRRSPVRVGFAVLPSRPGVAIGSVAPRLDNPTLATVGNDVRQLTTDLTPDLRFYQHSVAELLDAHEPLVLVFASPGFCTSGTCGPTLERMKAAARTHPTIAFVQIESYAERFAAGRLQPVLDGSGNLQPSSALEGYSLPSETSVLVIDGAGLIHDIFDVVIGSGEVESVIEGLGS
jgi:hypothetical protein